MFINLSPQRSDGVLVASKVGDVLTINGRKFDFSSVPDGATIPYGEVPCDWIVGPVERISGRLHLTLMLPHGPNPSSRISFPEPIISPPDGPLVLPEEEAGDVEA